MLVEGTVTMPREGSGYWNVWWTLMVLAMVFTFAIVILEYVGAFRDLGIILSVFGLLAGIFFGLTASTRSSVTTLSAELRGVGDEVHAVGDAVREVRRVLEERLPPGIVSPPVAATS
jgi:hypothetical protein